MRKISILLFAILFNSMGIAQENQQWIRYASISPDGEKIVFTYKGDLYLVPFAGGEAKPLTFHPAHDYKPIWNHDGTKISFASDRFGNFDVYVIDANGGEPLRLTYHSNPEEPYSFTHDNHDVIFSGQRLDAVNHRQYPTGSQPEVYMVPVKGGRVDQLWTIPAEDITIGSPFLLFPSLIPYSIEIIPSFCPL